MFLHGGKLIGWDLTRNIIDHFLNMQMGSCNTKQKREDKHWIEIGQ